MGRDGDEVTVTLTAAGGPGSKDRLRQVCDEMNRGLGEPTAEVAAVRAGLAAAGAAGGLAGHALVEKTGPALKPAAE